MKFPITVEISARGQGRSDISEMLYTIANDIKANSAELNGGKSGLAVRGQLETSKRGFSWQLRIRKDKPNAEKQ